MNVRFLDAKNVKSIAEAKQNIINGSFIFCEDTDRLYIKMHDEIIGITPAKREIKKIACKSCGAPLKIPSIGSIVQCEFCRSVYDIDSWNLDVEG